MRNWIKATLTCALLVAAGTNLAAAEYPDRAIRVVIPTPPAGGTDVLARIIAEPLSQRLGQPVVIDNKAGAGGNLGVQAVARSQPDGYTLLFTYGGNITINPFVYKVLGFDPDKDLVPITEAATATYLLVANPELPVKSVGELINLANSTKEGLQWASAPVGTPDQLCGDYMKMLSSANITYIPYRGSIQALTDIMAGRIAFGFFTIPTASGQVAGGKVRALAVSSKERSKLAPDLPTMDEAGVKGFEMATAYGFWAPTGTPPEVIEKIRQEVKIVVNMPAVKAKIEALGWEIVGSTPDEFKAKLADQVRVYGKIIAASGVQKQ
jgi:tripartite-type tricarboxylate transporter receptor subunit TctC